MMNPTFQEFAKLPVVPPHFLVYIDGYNLYGAINHPKPEYLFRLGWCNYQQLGELLVEKSFACGTEKPAVTVKYFTVKVYEGTPNQHKGEMKRQKMWFAALEKEAPKLKVVWGQWSPAGGRTEKMTDVNIALEIARDIIDIKPAGIVLVSGDLDFQPVADHATDKGAPIVVFTPDDHKKYNLPPTKDASRARFEYLTQDLLEECHLKSDFMEYLRLKVQYQPEFGDCLKLEERLAKQARR
jgi:hypothetical protein